MLYLEFEHNRYREWTKVSLRSVVDDLEGLGYECFFALDKGKLIRITGCWHDSWTRAPAR